MREDLENELIVALTPLLKPEDVQAAKLKICMVVNKYDIQLAETSLTVWDGDRNEVILKRFIMAKVAQGCSPRTIHFYTTSVRKVLLMIGKPYDEVTADDIRYWMAIRVQRDGVSKVTVNNEYRALSSFYTWLQREEILLKNPMMRTVKMKETKVKKKAYSLMELEKIRAACRTMRETAMVEILASTWCRVSEVCMIRISDMHQDKCIVHGKGDKDREVYINAKAALAIEMYMKERKDNNPYLFPKARYNVAEMKDMKNSAYAKIIRQRMAEWYMVPEAVSDTEPIDKSTYESVIRKIGRRAGVENVHPHRFRRTGATMALRQGMPLTTVSKLLGHRSIETTQIYLDISDEELEAAHRKYVV